MSDWYSDPNRIIHPQCRLSGTVWSDDSDPRIKTDVDVDVPEQDLVRSVPEGNLIELQNGWRDLLRLGETERLRVLLFWRCEFGKLDENVSYVVFRDKR